MVRRSLQKLCTSFTSENINITILLNDLNVLWVFCLVLQELELITDNDHDVEHLKTSSGEQNNNIFGLAVD